MSIILGINAYHPDSSACLLVDGELISAVEEERLRRVKHWGGFPSEAIKFCLSSSSIDLRDVDAIAVNSAPLKSLRHRFSVSAFGSFNLVNLSRKLRLFATKSRLSRDLVSSFGSYVGQIRVFNFDHHDCHLASAFCLSPYFRSLVLSVDGFGDGQSAAWGIADEHGLKVLGRIRYPHSLGIFYQAVTQYLGFWNYGDEYKVMGLAPYAKSQFKDIFEDVVVLMENGEFRLNPVYFNHISSGIEVRSDNGSFTYGQLFSEKFVEKYGPPRSPSSELTSKYVDFAWAAQFQYEKALFNMMRLFNLNNQVLSEENLCIAGGCAMNSVANGRLSRSGVVRSLHVQCAPGDAGGAVGAAFLAHQRLEGRFPEKYRLASANRSPYLGPSFTSSEVESCIDSYRNELKILKMDLDRYGDAKSLCRNVARMISDGRVVGWFQGAAEFGPRALGNRSILADPRRQDMRDLLNRKIKLREGFRPFAPSVLCDRAHDWFESALDVPYMSMVGIVKPNKRSLIPAVTHTDGSGRLQTVDYNDNPLFYELISAFSELTSVPILLNTSFNENEPIVTTPAEALDCFLRTEMDALVLGNILLSR